MVVAEHWMDGPFALTSRDIRYVGLGLIAGIALYIIFRKRR